MKRIIPLTLAICLFNSTVALAQQPAFNKSQPARQHTPHAVESLPELTASEALELIERGALTSEAYVSALLQRADALESLNVFISRDPAAALAAARLADRRRVLGLARGRLNGLPVIVKDNINSADLRTTAGTPGLAANRPTSNASVLQKLLDEGAILLGKSNMHELAFGATSNNAAFGAVRNPYDLSRIPGGSSGGTAAAIAARYAGLAGLSLPLGLTNAGLPIGLEVDGLEGSDETVLGIGLSMEKALPRVPPPMLP